MKSSVMFQTWGLEWRLHPTVGHSWRTDLPGGAPFNQWNCLTSLPIMPQALE
ncbi:MAG TPA: hypothetical protein PLI05_11340 [Methanotrichaceae archaeon]|nr:hypothetical protein [Methanotrichaceae archaeon]HQI92232.1 hypothetical protein [Methanotrichaceae archaeon]